MSVSSLPEWKQLLLDRKRREEAERGLRERQEEEKLANMPAWKRGIIQRRKARQDGHELCAKRDGHELCAKRDGHELCAKHDGHELCAKRDGEPRHELYEAPCLSDGLSDTDSTVTVLLGSDVSLSPDPGVWLDSDKPTAPSQVSVETIASFHDNPFIRTQKKEQCSPKCYDSDAGRGRDVEIKTEKFRDLSEGRERSRQREGCQDRSVPKGTKDLKQWKNQEKEVRKVRKDEDNKDTEPSRPAYSPIVPCLRTIRAENIIIIEQERKSNEERRGRWREGERDNGEEEKQSKRGLKMDLKEILAGGGSITEIRASEVLIIKPPDSPDGRTKVMKEDADSKREGRELRADMSWLREKVRESVKERPWGQATVIKEDKKDNLEDSVFVERGGRVSQLLSKFGEQHKPPSRSKSSDNLKPLTRKSVGDEEEEDEEERRSSQLKGVPKRSFSFSDRVFSTKENGFGEEGGSRGRIQSDKAHWTEVGSLGRETAGKIKMGCARLLERDRFGKHRHWQNKEKTAHRNDRRHPDSVDGEDGFTVACVKNIEGISFAKRVSIRQEVKVRSLTIMDLSMKKEAKVSDTTLQAGSSSSNVSESSYRHQSPFKECPSLLCTVQCSSENPGLAWSSEVGEGTVLPDHKEELISELEQVGDTKDYCTEKVARPQKTAFDVSKNLEEQFPCDSGSGSLDAKKISNFGVQPAPLEIQIPRTVFYVAEEMLDKNKTSEMQECESGKEEQRRDSWRTGKPLSQIKSLKEKIRDEQMESRKHKDESDSEVDEMCDKSTVAEVETEQEAQSQIGKSAVCTENRVTEYDVKQEVTKDSPPLPVSKLEEDDDTDSQTQLSDDVVESAQDDRVEAEESLEEEKSDEEIEELTLESEESLSPSPPPDPNSLEAMSRIYNLETVGSRSGLCLREKAVDIPSVHLIKIKSLNSTQQQQQQGETCGVQTIQRHFENFNLKEQEAVKSQSSPSILKDKEAKWQHSPKVKTAKEQTSPNFSPSPDQTITINSSILRCQSPENALKIFDLAPTPASSPCSPSPAQSPNISPSPSPTPALFTIRSASGGQVKRGTTFTITPKRLPAQGSPRSAQGSPRSAQGSPTPTQGSPTPAQGSPAPAQGSPTPAQGSPTPTQGSPTPAQGSPTPTQGSPTLGSNAAPEKSPLLSSAPGSEQRKRYPTVEEIEVIGGYQSLERSCLQKNRRKHKKVKVCFSEDRLEQLCEYPSESSMMGGSPYPQDCDPEDRVWTEPNPDPDSDPEDETAVKVTRSVGTVTGRGLRVGQCHPLLKKHSV